jgi:glutaminase
VAGTNSTSPVARYLHELLDELRTLDGGEVASYIPELGSADPDLFGITVVATDGHVFEAGDSRHEFTIQSISKPFVFGLALQQHGRERVLEHVGVEPSGNPFNAIAIDAANRPFNPMVNAGAIVTTGLIDGGDADARRERLEAAFARFAGRELAVDERVFASERATGDRNRALAYLMRSVDMLDGDVDETVDLYFRQCSLLVDSRDLAVMAATLANRGVNPMTGTRALDAECVESVLSVMGTCGMYDYAGEWAYRVGLPAKSGVSGGVIAVLPGQFGIGVFSPPVDAKGNSVRGIETCRRLATDFSLHPLRFRPHVDSAIRRSYRGHEARSHRVRSAPARDLLASMGSRIAVYELEGDLHFGTMERVYRAIVAELDGVEYVVLDCKRVRSIDEAALEMLVDLQHALHAAEASLVLSYVEKGSLAARQLGVLAAHGGRMFADTDDALEACEDALLDGVAATAIVPEPTLAAQELLQGLTDDELRAVEKVATTQLASTGERIVHEGDDGDSIFFVLAGSVSVRVELDGERSRRLSTLGAGVAFGEMAMLDDGRRSADVVADEDTLLARVSVAELRELGERFPNLVTTVYRNLAANLARRLRSANDQVRALEQ